MTQDELGLLDTQATLMALILTADGEIPRAGALGAALALAQGFGLAQDDALAKLQEACAALGTVGAKSASDVSIIFEWCVRSIETNQGAEDRQSLYNQIEAAAKCDGATDAQCELLRVLIARWGVSDGAFDRVAGEVAARAKMDARHEAPGTEGGAGGANAVLIAADLIKKLREGEETVEGLASQLGHQSADGLRKQLLADLYEASYYYFLLEQSSGSSPGTEAGLQVAVYCALPVALYRGKDWAADDPLFLAGIKWLSVLESIPDGLEAELEIARLAQAATSFTKAEQVANLFLSHRRLWNQAYSGEPAPFDHSATPDLFRDEVDHEQSQVPKSGCLVLMALGAFFLYTA